MYVDTILEKQTHRIDFLSRTDKSSLRHKNGQTNKA